MERCRPIRKMLGGGMRQAGVLAAAALVALNEGPGRLWIDHENAKLLAEGLASIPGIQLDPRKVQTNIVIFGVDGATMSAAAFLEALRARGVAALPVDATRVRMVTHLHVDRAAVEGAISAVTEVMKRR
nr:Beta-eliminating lyase [uncultured bacterium]